MSFQPVCYGTEVLFILHNYVLSVQTANYHFLAKRNFVCFFFLASIRASKKVTFELKKIFRKERLTTGRSRNYFCYIRFHLYLFFLHGGYIKLEIYK